MNKKNSNHQYRIRLLRAGNVSLRAELADCRRTYDALAKKQKALMCLADRQDQLLSVLRDLLPWVIIPAGERKAVEAVKRAGEALGKISS